MQHEQIPWSMGSQEYAAVNAIQLDRPTYRDDVQHQSSKHILAQKHKFDAWLSGDDSMQAANCLLVLCNRLIQMLHRQIEHLLNEFKEEGGFTEGLTAERLSHRTQKSIAANAPTCPVCGKPMIKRVINAEGETFFVGRDVATALGYSNTRDALNRHVDKEDRDGVVIHDSIGRQQKAVIINENGHERMSSLEIAELSGKPHNDVMKAIRKMEIAWQKVQGGNFSLSSRTYELQNGGRKEVPCYMLTRC